MLLFQKRPSTVLIAQHTTAVIPTAQNQTTPHSIKPPSPSGNPHLLQPQSTRATTPPPRSVAPSPYTHEPYPWPLSTVPLPLPPPIKYNKSKSVRCKRRRNSSPPTGTRNNTTGTPTDLGPCPLPLRSAKPDPKRPFPLRNGR